jgi:putative transposase
MGEMVLDNGLETANQTIQNIAATLGFKLTYRPPGCPNVKARIERFFLHT